MNKSIDKDKKTHKRRKIVLIILITLLILSIAGVVFVICYFSDNNKNEYVKKNISSSEIITKNLVNGFSNTSSSGIFSFSLEENDINELLLDSLDEVNDEKIKSIYYKQGEENHHYFYVDIDVPVINTRVVIDVTGYINIKDKCIYLPINEVKIGKYNAFSSLVSKGYLSNDFVSKIARGSGLPISYVDSLNVFKYEPLKFIEDFPLDTSLISKSIFLSVKDDLSIVSLNPSNLGFNVDLSKLRNLDYQNKSTLNDELLNISDDLSSNLSLVNLSSLGINEEKIVYSLNIDEINKYIKKAFNEVDKIKETIFSSFINKGVDIKVDDLYLKIVDSYHFNIVIDVNMNGYVINVNIINSVYEDNNNFILDFCLNPEVLIGSKSYSGINDVIVNTYTSIYKDVLDNIEYSFIKGNSSNYMLTLDLSNELETLKPLIDSYNTFIRVNPVSNSLEFVISDNTL